MTEFELECMQAVGGEFIEKMGVNLNTRQDLDNLIERLLSFGLLGC